MNSNDTMGPETPLPSGMIRPGVGQYVPSEGTVAGHGPLGMASWLLLVFGGLVLANTAVSAIRASATGADWSFAVLVALTAAATARSLWLDLRWARWFALALALVGLFFVLPVTGAILFSGTAESVGTGWDVVFFPLTTVVLVALPAALRLRRRGRPSNDPLKEVP